MKKKINKEEYEELLIKKARQRLVRRIKVHGLEKDYITPQESQRITEGWR